VEGRGRWRRGGEGRGGEQDIEVEGRGRWRGSSGWDVRSSRRGDERDPVCAGGAWVLLCAA